tara:strand:- start:2040 stop:2144 length:105 start_codon:yes stop_codon:yes gene_type:complete
MIGARTPRKIVAPNLGLINIIGWPIVKVKIDEYM